MKIAIIKLSSLGDIVHSMVVLQFIKQNYPKVKIDWVVEEAYKELLTGNPNIDNIFTVNFKKIKKKKSVFDLAIQLSKIRKIGKYDIVVDMQGLIKSALVSFFIKSDVTLGFDRKSVREKASIFFYNKTFNFPYDQNIIQRNISIISYILKINISIDLVRMKSPFLYTSKKYIFNEIDDSKKNILIIPGASFKSKRYPVKKYSEIISKINANFIAIWGNDEEKILVSEIKSCEPKVHICDKLSLDELISLISQVDLIIGSDTGPTHMAWALNIPSITIYGPTPGNRNSFVSDSNRVIESDSIVNPFKINKNDFSINNIEARRIIEELKDLLKIE